MNARGLDIRIRAPSGFDAVERAARAGIAKRFTRGAFNVSLTLTRMEGQSEIRVNRPLLDQFVALSKEYGEVAPSISSLLMVRGVIEQVGEDDDEAAAAKVREAAILGAFNEAVDALADMRAEEGLRLDPVLRDRVSEIESLVRDAESSSAARPEAIAERLRTQIAALLDAAPAKLGEQMEQRLAQELAVLATKADIREELDRLTAHIAAARELLAQDEASGRKLDFLCQEFNREANTLCSKSGDVALTRTGLTMKAVVDQLREQVQNVE